MLQSRYVLQVEGVSYAYRRGEEVLKGISFEVQAGQIVCLLGPSGCGKSTLLRIIAGLLKPTVGRVLIDGQDQAHVPSYRRNLGFVFQDAALFPHLTVEENIAFPFRRGRRTISESWPKAVSRILEATDLRSYRNRNVATLSGGQAQRVALARALVYQPSLLLLDEPLSSLDNRLKAQLLDLLIELHERYGTSFIYVSHDEREALQLGNFVMVINERHELQQFGSVTEVLNNPSTADVATIVGGWNLLHATVTQEGKSLGVRLQNGSLVRGFTLDRPLGAKVLLGFPFRAAQIVSSESALPPGQPFVPVRVVRRSPWYASWSYECLVEGEQGAAPARLSCFGQSDDGLPSLDLASVTFRREDIRVFE